MSIYCAPVTPDELYHHGVKGMRWGVRRYQNQDGSYTSVGRQHYGIGAKVKIPSKLQNARHIGATLKEGAIKAKAYWDNLPEERKEQIKKTLAIGAGITAAAVVGSAAYRYGLNHCDRIIRTGAKLQTLSYKNDRLNTIGKHNSFYTVYNPSDKMIYNSMFSGGTTKDLKKNPIKWLKKTGTKYKNTAKVTSNMKIASPANSEKVFEELRKTNPEFERLTKWTQREQAVNAINKVHKRRPGYDSFNFHSLAADNKNAMRAKQIYFDEMKKRGYHGIIDVNDMKYSSFNSRSPSIIFDKTNIMTSATESKKVGKLQSLLSLPFGLTATAVNHMAQRPAEVAGLGATITGAAIAKDIIKSDAKKKKRR